MNQWCPIETARIDGTPVLLCNSTDNLDPTIGHYEDGQWGILTTCWSFFVLKNQPDYYMLLPTKPEKNSNPEP